MQPQLALHADTSRQPVIRFRPYQEDCISTVFSEYEGGVTRQLVQAATGAGKTIVFSEIIRQHEQRALVIVNRDELVRQTIQKINLVAPNLSVGVVQAQQNDYGADVVVATVQTAHRPDRLRNLTGFGAVVADEAHYSVAPTWQAVLERTVESGTLLTGWTATPERSDGNGLGDTFEKLVWSIELMDLIAQGYLTDIKAVRVSLGFDLKQLKANPSTKDYSDEQLGQAMEDAESPASIAEALVQHAPDRKSVVFLPTVATAQATADALNALGHPAAVVVGTTPTEERQRIYEQLRRGQIKAMCGVMVFAVGFDLPEVNCVCIARPTTSRPLYVQMAGRGLRLSPGKKDCLVIDCVGVTDMKLMSIADMTGVSDEDIGEGGMSVLEAAEAQAERDELDEIEHGERRRIIARAVDVFHRETMAWIPSDTMHVLPVGDVGSLAVALNDEGTWDVIKVRSRPKAVQTPYGWRKPKDDITQRVEVVAGGLDAELAQGVAEGIARQHQSKVLIDPKANWRSTPASEAQRRVLGKAFEEGMTKGQASDATTMKFTVQDLTKARSAGIL